MPMDANLFGFAALPGALLSALALVVLVAAAAAFRRFKPPAADSFRSSRRNWIVENLREGIIVFDEELRMTDINPAARNFFAIAEDAALGQSAAELFNDFPDLLEQLAGQSASPAEISIKGTTERVYLEVTVTPMTGAAGLQPGRVALIRDVTEREKLRQDVERLALTDSLTGLSNRKYFFQICELEIKRARRYQHPLALLLADIDFFHQVNAQYGYAAGDKALKVAAASLRDRLRQSDIVGRYGGQKFAILLPETELSAALITAERIRQGIAALSIRAEGATFNFSVSVGVAGLEGESLSDLVNAAEAALRRAKEQGRNRVAA